MKKMSLLPALGVVVFIYLILQVGISSVMENLARANVLYLTVAFSVLAPIFLIKIFKWNYLIRAHQKNHSFASVSQPFLASYFLSLVTPGKIGDLSRSLSLKRDLKMP